MTSPKSGKGGGEVQKMSIWGDFKGLTEVKKGGRGSKNWKIGMTSFMDGPQSKKLYCHKIVFQKHSIGQLCIKNAPL